MPENGPVVRSFTRWRRVKIKPVLNKVLSELNRKLTEVGRGDPQSAGMGATVAGLACGVDGLFAFNVGDARVYRKQDGYLRQITKDDSVAQLLVEMGRADPDEVRAANFHRLTQAIGGRSRLTPIEPHIESVKLNGPQRFLLCTDGLTDMVDIDQMEQIVSRNGNAVGAASDLFRAAMEAGGNDNTTIIVADIGPASYS